MTDRPVRVMAPAGQLDALLSVIGEELQERARELDFDPAQYDWDLKGRPNQFAPEGDWATWVLKAGRGFGKTRSAAEHVRRQVATKRARRIALVGATAADVRDIMVEGPAGLIAIHPPDNRPEYQPSRRRVVWKNGATAYLYSAEEPDRLRGPEHDLAWCDELASWKKFEAWSNLQMGLRQGESRCIVTTTPRPRPILKSILADPATVVTTGSTYENRPNLSERFFRQVVSRYEGTRLGQQELEGRLLEDVEGALWRREQMIERYRVREAPDELKLIVVAIDPAGSDPRRDMELKATGAENQGGWTGIVCAGLGFDNHGYVLDDVSLQGLPHEWATRAISLYEQRDANKIVAEKNFGGAMVESTLRSIKRYIPIKVVVASRGKLVRAEPVSALYEQGKVHHVTIPTDRENALVALEDQMCTWVPGDPSPDRMDALVWAMTELFGLAPTDEKRKKYVAPVIVQGRSKGWSGPGTSNRPRRRTA